MLMYDYGSNLSYIWDDKYFRLNSRSKIYYIVWDCSGWWIFIIGESHFFSKKYQESFQSLLHKKGRRAEWEYPFAVAGINISFMLAQMLDVQSCKPSTTNSNRLNVHVNTIWLDLCMNCLV
ncbi:hypothetical protein MKX01_027780 [Papaver californicum]|nr:hypothetical protein MKX01_027780 [Papaver californicum]